MTRNNESYRTKGRAVFLAAIMVISMLAMPVAFTGGVAALDDFDDAEGDFEIDEVLLGNYSENEDETTYEISHFVDNDSEVTDVDGALIEFDASNPSSIGEDDVTVEVDGEELFGVEEVSSNNTHVGIGFETSDPIPGDAQIDITLEDGVENPDAGTHEVSTHLADNVGGVADGGGALDGATDVISTDAFEYRTLTDETVFEVAGEDRDLLYEGQEAEALSGHFDRDDIDNQEISLRSVDDFDGDVSESSQVDELVVEENDEGIPVVEIDTDGLDDGDYFLRGGDLPRNPPADETFELTEQRLDVEFEDDEVADDGSDALIDIEFDSNRGSYDVNVSADGDLDTEELQDIFIENPDTDFGNSTSFENNFDDFDDEDRIGIHVERDDDYQLNFTGVDEGDYDFDFEVEDTNAEASDSITVIDAGDGELNVNDVDVSQGGIATFEVEFDNTEEGLLVIGEEDNDGYQANVSIDSDGEDTVIVHFNTYAAGNEDIGPDQKVTLDEDSDAEEAVLHNSQSDFENLSSILDTGDYQVSTYATSDTDESAFYDAIDDPDNIATMTVNERSELDATQWRIGDDVFDDLEEEIGEGDEDAIEFIAEGVENDLVTETDMFAVEDPDDGNAPSDYQVHQISADGIQGLLVNATGDAQFDDVDTIDALEDGLAQNNSYAGVNEDDYSLLLEIEQTNEGSNQDPLEIPLNDVAANGELSEFTAAAYDEDEEDYYIVIDTNALIDFVEDDIDNADEYDFERELEEGQDFEVSFAVQDARLLDETDDEDDLEDLYEEINWEFDLEEAEGDYLNMNDDDFVEAENTEDSEIMIETNVAPGTELDIRARNAPDTSPSFINTDRDVVVDVDGEATGVFDFSEQSVDDEFETEIRQAAFELEEDGIFVDAVAEEPEDDEADDEDDVVDDEDDVVDDEDDVVDDDDDVEDVDDETPGFGAIVALVALIGAALLAVRRQN